MVRLGLNRRSLRKSFSQRRGSSATASSHDDAEVLSAASSVPGTQSTMLSMSAQSADEDDPVVEAVLDGPAKEKKAVVAIDFGTTNTGLAYGMTAPSKRHVHILREKEPTCALFAGQGKGKKHKLLEFGQAARDMYRQGQAGEQLMAAFFATEQTGWDRRQIFIDQAIKMELYEATSGNDEALEEQVVQSAGGITYFEVVSAIIERLGALALMEIAKREGESLSADEVLWVLTVPSIWRESDKQFMRRCAHAGGLVADEFSADLVIALESECAAVWAKVVLERTDPHKHHQLSAGDTVVCLDCGGGTVDVAAISLLEPEAGSEDKELRMSQLLPPTGLKLGAKDVDKRFFNFLGGVIGHEALDTAWETPDVRLELQDGWEAVKLKLRPEHFRDENTHKIRFSLEATITELGIRLPDVVVQANRRARAKYGEEAIQIEYKRALTRASTTILLPARLLRHCFDPVVDSIVELAKETIIGRLGLPEVKHLILFGGLGGSCYLKQKINQEFSEDINIHVAHKPNLTVMRGAVKYGFFPSIVRSRRARLTVGVKVNMPFVRGKHNKKPHLQHRAYDKIRREHYLQDAFKTFVRRGELVDVQREYSHTFEPASKLVDRIKFDVYATSAEDCDYVTEVGCQKLATIYIPVEKGAMRRVICSLSFGHTEIVAKVLDTDGELLHRLPIVYYRGAESAVMTAAAAQEQLETEHQYNLAAARASRSMGGQKLRAALLTDEMDELDEEEDYDT